MQRLTVVFTLCRLNALCSRGTGGLGQASRWIACAEHVFKELATQAWTYTRSFAHGAPTAGHWKWKPRYANLPPRRWHAQPDIVTIGMVRRRLHGKGPAWLPRERVAKRAAEANASPEGLGRAMKRRRIRGKTTQPEGWAPGVFAWSEFG